MNPTIIDLQGELETTKSDNLPDDLGNAIQALIQRLRDANPIPDVDSDEEL